MNTEVKKIDNTKREINVEVSGEVVKNKFEDVFKRIAKDAKAPGFRLGNVPRDILEKNYSSAANELVLKELIPELYNQAVEKEKLEIVELPEISDVKVDRNSLSFKATVEISPEIAIKNYRGLKLNYKKIQLEPEEVKRNLDSLKESRKIDNIDDSFARSLGYPNAAELEKAVERQVLIQKDNLERQKLENQVIEQISSSVDFKLPKSLVNRQLEDLARQAKLDLALKGMAREKIDAEENKLFTELQPEAKKQVKIYLILAEIAKKENIAQDEHMPRRVMEFLLKEADWQNE